MYTASLKKKALQTIGMVWIDGVFQTRLREKWLSMEIVNLYLHLLYISNTTKI
jgi:hypothetical protein